MVLETGKKVEKDVGIVTILVNNAGIMPQHDLLKHTEKEIRMIFEINTLAHFWMFEAFLPKMIERNQGHIVALSSMAGAIGVPNLVPYCGKKLIFKLYIKIIKHFLKDQNLRCAEFRKLYQKNLELKQTENLGYILKFYVEIFPFLQIELF